MKKCTRHLMFAFVVALPLVVLPSTWLSHGGVKTAILAIFALALLVVGASALYRKGVLLLPQTSILGIVALLPIAYGLSVLFAEDKARALFNTAFASDSFVGISLGVVVLCSVALLVVKAAALTRMHTLLLSVSAAVALVFSVQVLSLAGVLPAFLSLGGNLIIASWLDVATLVGLGVVLALTLPSSGKRMFKIQLPALVLLLVVLVSITNLSFVWIVLVAVSAGLLVERLYGARTAPAEQSVSKKAFILPLLVLVVSAGMLVDTHLFKSAGVASLQRITEVSFVDVRPSWAGTLDIGKEALLADGTRMLFGPGVGSFDTQWRLYKPVSVNTTNFWSQSFNTGIGLVPTSVVTGGFVVLGAWALFLLTVFGATLRYRRATFAMPTLFLWVMALFAPIGIVSLVFAFLVTGLFVAELVILGKVRSVQLRLKGEGRSVGALVSMAVVIIVAVGVVGVVAQRVTAEVLLQRAAQALIAGNANDAERLLLKAKPFSEKVLIERAYTQVALSQLGAMLQASSDTETEPDVTVLQGALSNVLAHARNAIELDPTNPEGYIALGAVSEQLVALGVEGSVESAIAAYTQAATLDPKNPAIPFALARVYLGADDIENATAALEATLTLKGNLVPALYQYGVIKFSGGDTATAIQALGAAVQNNPNYANALYYLSLALAQEARFEESYVVMQRVQVLNPDNQDVVNLLEQIQQQIIAQRAPAAVPNEEQEAGAEPQE